MKRAQWCGILLLLICCTGVAAAQATSGEYYTLLFSSNGCSSCGDVDMFVFTELTASYPEFVVVDYELSEYTANSVLNRDFSETYGVMQSIPKMILGNNLTFIGKTNILTNITPILDAQRNGTFADSTSLLTFETLDISSLDGYPKLWRANRVLIFEEGGADAVFLKNLINTPDINGTLAGHQYETITPPAIQVGKQNITFEHAVRVEGWVLQWNDVELPADANSSVVTPLAVWGALGALAVVAVAAAYKKTWKIN